MVCGKEGNLFWPKSLQINEKNENNNNKNLHNDSSSNPEVKSGMKDRTFDLKDLYYLIE